MFSNLKKEYIRNVKNCSKGSNIANHAWRNNHFIETFLFAHTQTFLVRSSKKLMMCKLIYSGNNWLDSLLYWQRQQ